MDAELFTTGLVVSHSARSLLGFRGPISVEFVALDIAHMDSDVVLGSESFACHTGNEGTFDRQSACRSVGQRQPRSASEFV